MRYRLSRYNLVIESLRSKRRYLLNSFTASVISLPHELLALFNALENHGPAGIQHLPVEAHGAFNLFIDGGFIVPEGLDELKRLIDDYESGIHDTTLALTLAPTMACNLCCKYCYQVRSQERMDRKVCEEILRYARQRMTTGRFSELEVDWYGGEPLLALDIIEHISTGLIKIANETEVSYRASVCTNGTLLDLSTVALLATLGVTDCQVTLDGPPHIHNAQRPFKEGEDSFTRIIEGIKRAADAFDVSVRINIDRDTLPMAFDVLDILEDNGCLGRRKAVVPYISMIGPMSSRCMSAIHNMVSLQSFYETVLDFQREVLAQQPDLSPDRVFYLPRKLARPCGAVSPNSICVHPSGRVYKCGLEVHEPAKGGDFLWQDYSAHANYRRWLKHDPFVRGKCRNCKLLPICLGGCPKFNFQKDHFYEGEACQFYDTYLRVMIDELGRGRGA